MRLLCRVDLVWRVGWIVVSVVVAAMGRCELFRNVHIMSALGRVNWQ